MSGACAPTAMDRVKLRYVVIALLDNFAVNSSNGALISGSVSKQSFEYTCSEVPRIEDTGVNSQLTLSFARLKPGYRAFHARYFMDLTS